MELNTASLLAMRTRYDTMFNQAFNLAESTIDKAAFVMNCGRVAQGTHRWMRGLQGMREFIGARKINNVSNDGFTIVNKKWEDTVGIPVEDFERDTYGLYDPLITRLGQVAKLHRDTLGYGFLSSALAAATAASYLAYDGQALFGSHTAGRVTKAQFTNILPSNPVLSEASLQTAKSALKARYDSAGNLLNVLNRRPLLICHTDNEAVAEKLATLSFIVGTQPGTGASSATSQAGATENQLKGTFDYFATPLLTTGTEWYLTYTDAMFKPLIFQIEQDVSFQSWDKFLQQWTMEDQFVNGVKALYNVGAGLPESVVASRGTGS